MGKSAAYSETCAEAGEDDLVRRVSGTGTEVPLSGVQDTIVSSAEFVPYYSLNVYYSESSIEVAYFDTNYPFSQIFPKCNKTFKLLSNVS